MSARDEVLARVRDAHRLAPPPDLPYEAISREYRTSRPETRVELLALLADRLADYKAAVRLSTADQLAATVAAALAERGVRSLAVPPGLPEAWVSDAGVEIHRDSAGPEPVLTVDALDHVDGVLTGCALAVAETGHARPRRLARPGPACAHPGARLPPLRRAAPTRSSPTSPRRSRGSTPPGRPP